MTELEFDFMLKLTDGELFEGAFDLNRGGLTGTSQVIGIYFEK